MSIVTKFNLTGPCEIDVPAAMKKWNHLWWISDYGGEYRLIKHKRKDSPLVDFKVGISSEVAQKLIKDLGLAGVKSQIFKKATSYRRQEDWTQLVLRSQKANESDSGTKA